MTVDLGALLQPLHPDAPCGEDLAFSAAFDAIANARRYDEADLPQGVWQASQKTADWPAVVRITAELLLTRSKDLRLAGWWAEAQARDGTRGWRGLADGLALVGGLVRDHWDHVHPQPDGGDFERRINVLAWLLNQVGKLAGTVTLPLGRQADGRCELQLGLADIQRLRTAPAAQDEAAGAERLARALRETPASVWSAQLADHQAACTALVALEDAVDACLGADGPGFRWARDALERAGHELLHLARQSGWRGGPASAQAVPAAVAGTPAAAPALPSTGPIRDREDAVQRLRQVAEWFRRAEPHSPAGYLAEKAAHWAGMPLHEWLRVVLKEEGSLSHVEELLGLGLASPKPAE